MLRLPWRKHSDSEYVEDIRRSVRFWNRFRVWMLAMYFCVLAGFIWLAIKGVDLLLAIVQPGNNVGLPWLGFAAGAAVGYILGWTFVHTIHGIIFGLGGLRSERLLLQFYDAARQCPNCAERVREESGDAAEASMEPEDWRRGFRE